MQDIVIDALEKGNTWRCAAEAAGVSWGCMTLWKRKGRDTGEEPYASFYALTKAAANRAERAVVNCFHKAATEDWKAAQAYAERRYWREWWLGMPAKGKSKDPSSMSHDEMRDALVKELARIVQNDDTQLDKLLAHFKGLKDGK